MRVEGCSQGTYQQSTAHVHDRITGCIYYCNVINVKEMLSNVKVNNCSLHHAVNWITGRCVSIIREDEGRGSKHLN